MLGIPGGFQLMHRIFIFCCLFLGTGFASFCQVYTPQKAESQIAFAIKNFGLKTKGSLSGLAGSIRFDPRQLELSKFEISLSTPTIFTDNKARDNHLRKADYFDVAQYPLLQFNSTKIQVGSLPNQYKMEGLMTLKGKTQKLAFLFTALPEKNGFRFKGLFTLNRLDFGVGGPSLSLSDVVEVSLDVLAH